MKRLLGIIGLITLISSPVFADDPVSGVWKTEVSETTGGWLYVKIHGCDGLICGTIENAYSSDGEISEDYAHKGAAIIWDMQINGDGTYKKGKIRDHANEKDYSSKMALKGDSLDVKGCVWGICQAQTWVRVGD